jgi:RHS repeat-associated protein
MSIHSHLPYDQSTSHARIPAGGIDLIASIDSFSEAQFTASFFGSTKALHGEVATTSPATTTHNHSNQQYSVTAVTTSAGAIAERYAYSAYGEPTICDASGSTLSNSSISNRYSYTGREWDATVGLYHFRARWMSPKTGRFLGRDPLAYASDLLLYAYCSGYVLSALDPSGLDWLDNLANYSAGISDSLTMGLTSFVRGAVGINDGIDTSSGWYIAGEATEIVVEVAVTGGAAASRHIARKTVRTVVEGGARTAYRRAHKLKGGIIHHATPIKGHPGGKPSYFPLPYKFAARGSWNFQYLSNVGQHAAMHRRLIQQERLLRAFNISQPIRNGGNLIIQHILNDGPPEMKESEDSLPYSSIDVSFSASRTLYFDSPCPNPDDYSFSAAGSFSENGTMTFEVDWGNES